MQYEIERSHWEQCAICGKTLKDIKNSFGGSNKYMSQAFLNHIKEQHKINAGDYFQNTKLLNRPECSCGECRQLVDVFYRGSKLFWKQLKCGKNNGVKKWAEEAKVSRLGSNNPMYGKQAWNKNNNQFAEFMRQKRTGTKTSQESKEKMSKSARLRKIHGHTGHRHTEETRLKLAKMTAFGHANGRYSHTRTKPLILMMCILDDLSIKYREEEINNYYSFDLYLTEYDIYLEVDGDFFHSNPKFYPDGPKSKIQKRNYYNDQRKNSFCEERNIKLLRFWEDDIINNKNLIKKELLCILKK